MRSTLYVLFAICFLNFPSLAQNAYLSGLVKDKSDAVIVSASVTLSNVETGSVATAKTNGSGFFAFSSVVPGRYLLAGEAKGFAKTVIENIKIDTAANVSQDIVLQIGQAEETVTVNSAPSQLAQTTGAVSTVIDRPLIENMPLNGNSLQTLFELTPGIVTNAGGGDQSQGGGFSVNGQRPTSNYLTVDGVGENIYAPPVYGRPNVMGAGIATSASGGTNGLLPVDAVEEFRVQTSSYSAEYGRTPGGQIEVTTRGGTNAFHGSIFENFRNQVMDAQDWFIGYDNATEGSNLKQSPLRMNDFGGTFGGPILKNRLFFFVAHESLFMNQPQPPKSFDVPNQQTRNTAATVFQPYLNAYPLGNAGPDPNLTDSDIYNFSFSNMITDHSTSARIDARLPRNMLAFFRINDAPSYLHDPFPVGMNATSVDIMTFTSGLTWQISPVLDNEIAVNYSTTNSNTGVTGDPNALTQAASGIANISRTLVGFYPQNWLGLSVGAVNPVQFHHFNIVEDLTWAHAKHLVKFGADYRRISPSVSYADQLYLFTEYSSTGIPAGTVDYLEYEHWANPPHIQSTNLSLYSDDSWKVNPRMTLNLGIRWEYNPPPTASGFGLLAMQGDPTNPASIILAPGGTPLYNTSYGNWAPRLGVAYAVHDSSHFATTVRAGGGIFFDTGQTATAAQASLLSYPYQERSPLLTGVPYSSISTSSLQLTAASLPQAQLYLTDPHLSAPRTYEWSMSLDQLLGKYTTVSTSYIGNHGDGLLKQSVSQGLSPSLANTLYIYKNGESSSYNALQAQGRIRANNRVNVLASYSFAHALDNGSSDFVGVGIYQKNYKADSDNDIRHIFTSAIHYTLPGITNNKGMKMLTDGWGVDAIVLLQGASPLSVYSYNASNPNLLNTYADLVPGVPVVISDPLAPGGKRLNQAAFTCGGGGSLPCPSATEDGTSPRNGYRLFGLTQFDLTLGRSWRFGEEKSFTFRVTAFNVINHPNFAGVNTGYQSPLRTFGEATATYAGAYGNTDGLGGGLNQVFSNGGARSLQLSTRIAF